MRRISFPFAAGAAALALLLAAPAEVAAQDASVTGEQLEQAGNVPLIGQHLRVAVNSRRLGHCRARLERLQLATEMLEFARRYIRQNPATDKFDEDDLAAAQRALDREKREACSPDEYERETEARLAGLPVLTGTVVAVPSKLGADATVVERYSEFAAPLYLMLTSPLEEVDIDHARELMQSLYDLLAELRARRDGALGTGQFSTVDAWEANEDYLAVLERVRFFERFFHSRRADIEETQLQESEARQQSSPDPCQEGSSDKCAVPLSDDPLPPSKAKPLTGDERAMLDVHNKARHDFGVPPLLWDPGLAASAAEYAKVIAETGQLVHAPREGREHERENLLATNIGYRSPAEMIEVMVAEKQYYKPGIYPDISTTGDWYPVGHYTQIVWPWTTHVGCAIESGEFFEYTVCRYTPPGNRDGDPLYPGGYMPPPPPSPPP